ncbi:hypothetical protein Ahy_B09g097320 [Arachis hypogaea]|uniref:Uncharacterized protein n=1 Tax=Arachis hypogaea TaxID=3818 RepID=A0A444XPG3_ARAHY|nr:hypothetical protein Ahy_B09g097320 [Arachis hypogaea]
MCCTKRFSLQSRESSLGYMEIDWEKSYELSMWLFVRQMYLSHKTYYIFFITWVQLVTQSWHGDDNNVMFHHVLDVFSLCRGFQYADTGCKFGHMITNMSECINTVIKATHNLSTTALVKLTYVRLGEIFVRKGTEA